MSNESRALNFLNFYLGPFLSRKTLDLIKLDLIKRSRQVRATDPLLAEAGMIREMITLLKKRRKGVLSDLGRLAPSDAGFHELLKLPPEEAILLCSGTLFPVEISVLSLALNMPEASLLHRKKQLETTFKHHPVPLEGSGASPSRNRALRIRPGGLLSRIQALPLFLRILLESGTILGGLLGLLWIIPEIRNRYESAIQGRINDYLIENTLLDSPPPEGTLQEPKTQPLEESPESPPARVAKSSSEPAEPSKKQPKVNEGETWRFSFTGSATHEIEASIETTLQSFRIEGAKPTNVPGGIQFDLILEGARVLDLKTAFEKAVFDIQNKAQGPDTRATTQANLSWYKKRNMGTRNIPSGHVQVIIWISTL